MSTITTDNDASSHHMDYEQKMFEVGRSGSSIGIVTWGAGRFRNTSHRTIASQLGSEHAGKTFMNIKDMARRLQELAVEGIKDVVGGDTELSKLAQEYTDLRTEYTNHYAQQQPKQDHSQWVEFDEDKEKRLYQLHGFMRGGYFIAGRVQDSSECQAFEVRFGLADYTDKHDVIQLSYEEPTFRGIPDIMQRLVMGYDEHLAMRILHSGKWTGTPDELFDVLEVSNYRVRPELLPLRDAIDWVHTVIHTTIRAMKFSGTSGCGGPVEVAVITTDRPFRWVCHKRLDAAIIVAQEGRPAWSI